MTDEEFSECLRASPSSLTKKGRLLIACDLCYPDPSKYEAVISLSAWKGKQCRIGVSAVEE